jgi:hypothetical protein
MSEVTPGWRHVHIGVENDDASISGVRFWKSRWRRLPDAIVVAHPAYPQQRHTMFVYELDGPTGPLKFAAGEFSNGVWGFYVPESPVEAKERFRWGSLVVDCALRLRGDRALPGIVDVEVIPPLDGSPHNILAWFICATRAEVAPFRAATLSAATSRLRGTLLAAGLPAAAASSLRTDITSLEDIEAGGGRFAYFR